MKQFFGILMMLAGFYADVKSQLFIQDFSSSSNLTDYVGAPPNNMQFDVLGASGGGVTASITSAKLQFVRTTANAGGAIRNTDFSATPTLFKVEFDLEVPIAATSTTTAAQIYFGDGFSSNINAGDAGATFHTKIGINLVSGGGFQLRNIGGAVNSPTFSGENAVTIVSNNSGSVKNYTGPDGLTNSVADDKIDIWVNTSIVFNDMNANAAGAGANLNEFKFIFSNGSGTITLDNFLMTELTPLPVTLEYFKAALNFNAVEMHWRTAIEIANSHFFVERSADGRVFTAIGRVEGAGTSFEPNDYFFTDEFPLPGLNYCRLRQVDIDGSFSFSPVVTVMAGRPADIRLYPSPATDFLKVQWEKKANQNVLWEIFDQAGRLMQSGKFFTEVADFEINIAGLTEGVYTLCFSAGSKTWVERFEKM